MSTWSESPNCCPFSNGAVDVHFPLLSSITSFLLSLNVIGGRIGAPAATRPYYFCIDMSGHLTHSAWLNTVYKKRRSNAKVKRVGGHEGKEALCFTSQNIRRRMFSLLCFCILWHVTVCLSPFDLLVKFIVINRSYWGGVPLGNIGTQHFCSPVTFLFGNAD